RYGGDEFVILLEMNMDADVEKVIGRVEKGFEEWNAVHGRRYILECSIGYAVYAPESTLTMNEFLFRVDSLMYEQKRAKAHYVSPKA
nr:diguanylate cyclase [Clostridia bacterium]